MFTVGFELDVLRGKRPYRWTIWVSSLQLTNLTTASLKVAIPRNSLHLFTCLHLLPNRSGWPKASLSCKALVVLLFRVEIVINVYLFIAIDGDHPRKGAVPPTFFFPLNETLTSPGTVLYFLGVRFLHHRSPYASHPLDPSSL